METGVTLSRMLEDLAAECGETTNPNSRTHVRSYYVRLLQRHQRQLWQNYDWPHMRVWRDVNLAAGQRTYAFPSDLDKSRIEHAYIEWNRRWLPMRRMIEPPDYAWFDSDEDERFNPQMRWYLRENDEFEVWPLPSGNNQVVRFVGTKDLSPFVDDADTCDLDADMIVLFAAAQVLARRKSADAQLMANQAAQHLSRIRARIAPKEGFTFLGEPHSESNVREPFGPKPVDYTQGA